VVLRLVVLLPGILRLEVLPLGILPLEVLLLQILRLEVLRRYIILVLDSLLVVLSIRMGHVLFYRCCLYWEGPAGLVLWLLIEQHRLRLRGP
jgi:hypothetical protein